MYSIDEPFKYRGKFLLRSPLPDEKVSGEDCTTIGYWSSDLFVGQSISRSVLDDDCFMRRGENRMFVRSIRANERKKLGTNDQRHVFLAVRSRHNIKWNVAIIWLFTGDTPIPDRYDDDALFDILFWLNYPVALQTLILYHNSTCIRGSLSTFDAIVKRSPSRGARR